MNYIIIELQTNEGVTSPIVNTYTSYPLAEQAYHTILAAAAVSQITIHSASMLTERGNLVKYECYDRREPEEPEVAEE